MVKIAAIDSGREHDSTALLGGEWNGFRFVINIAKRWTKISFVTIEHEIADRHAVKPFSKYIVEKNNQGTHVIDSLKKIYKLPIVPVTTVNNLKDPKNHPESMDKNDTVKWGVDAIEKGLIVFANIGNNPELQEASRQITIYESSRTKTGKVTYSAPSGDHDDYTMTFLMLCWYIRNKLIRKTNPVIVGVSIDELEKPANKVEDWAKKTVQNLGLENASFTIKYPK